MRLQPGDLPLDQLRSVDVVCVKDPDQLASGERDAVVDVPELAPVLRLAT